MTGLNRRVVRLEWIFGLGIALLLPMPQVALAQAQTTATVLPTQTTLKLDARGLAGASPTTATASVVAADGQPATGVVNFDDGNHVLAEAVLNQAGEATAPLTLPAGSHALRAVYAGDAAHQASASDSTQVQTQAAAASAIPSFQLSLAPVSPATLPMTLVPGNSGTVTVTVVPVNNAALTSPMFITLSCSGLPTLASCSFSPADVEILPSTPASCPAGSAASACPPTSQMVISTQGVGTPTAAYKPSQLNGKSISFALLLPGVLGLGGLAWGARRRRWLQRLALVTLVGLVTTLGMTACNPFYYYYNHGPTPTPPTPAGTYTVTVTAQATNGVTATTNSTTLVLTVQ